MTSRVIEERFWLHPILTCFLEPRGRHARRACDRLRRHADKRLATVVRRANAMRGPYQPELTLDVARRIARNLAGSALARAQEKYGVEIYGVVVMSNHLHLLCRAPGRNLSAFMGYVKARLTNGINLLTGRRGPLWARRFDAQPVLDERARADRMGYLADNPRKAGLVDDSEHWPGLNLAYGTAEASQVTFTYFDATAWHRAKRPTDMARFFKPATLTLSPIPGCEDMPPDAYREHLRAWMQQVHDKGAGSKDSQGGSALGVRKVVETPFETRPKSASFSRRPYAFGAPEKLRAHREGSFALLERYAACAERYRQGIWDVEFPEGTYRPPLMRAA